MKIAVTGATGFIGKYVLAELSRYPVEVIALVRDISTAQLTDFSGKVIQCDLAQFSSQIFEEIDHPDSLIHLAWSGLPNYKSLHHFEEELPRQYAFLSTLIRSGLPSLVIAGTCFEYGMICGELSEIMLPQPSNPYGHAKNTLRCHLEYLQTEVPFSLAWARLFYLYGEGQSPKSLFSQLRESVNQHKTTFGMSEGEQLRDYLHVSQVAQSLVKLAMSADNPGIINVCSGKPVSVRRLVEQWIKENGWNIQLNLGYYPYPNYEPIAFWGDARKLENIQDNQKRRSQKAGAKSRTRSS
ncbi:epimerase [Limnothrix sp. PR1529]|uniref:NAD-dependent epimerase/dehydratase family protein n=1 Tax=Limnothrix sp. PR1529 TaxID=1704291 RepID=UPI00081E30C2|nr:NAD-dependent epimerase/dehydratase family protein [Limnothrix sp. PR1529]OCQ93818.1 epimerase [Limnothrix sp. P13C2]PIB05442.1 epimerase [Limnothrix sp. PR1529]